MEQLSQYELEDMWSIHFENADAETCFAIDKQYKLRFGYWALKEWMERRRKESISNKTLIILTKITLNGVKTTFTVTTKRPKGWDDKPEQPK